MRTTDTLTPFRILQLVVVIVFSVTIIDKRKSGIKPLLDEKVVLVRKFLYPIPIVLFVYVLVTLDRLFVSDFVALGLTIMGTILTIKARIDLGIQHTYSGYYSEASEVVTKGVYAYIRHPLYTGLCIFILGALSTAIPHNWLLTALASPALAYIVAFLAVVASRETELLARKYGEPFLKYQGQVHPFLPIRKFRG